MSEKNKKPSKKAIEKINKMTEEISDIWEGIADADNSDVLGSYTGNPKDFTQPEQDPDDL